MEKLAKTIESEAARYMPGAEELESEPVEVRDMQEAAKAWAASALETFTGELLTKALAVSAAMADFTSEYLARRHDQTREPA